MKFEIGQKVKLIEEQEFEDMCPIRVGDDGIIINIDPPNEMFDNAMLYVNWNNHNEQNYAVWDWEVVAVE